MQQPKTTSFPWTTVYCATTSAVFIPMSPWMSAPQVQYLQCPFTLETRVGNIQVQAAYQPANDPRNPDNATGFGNIVSTEGVEDPSDIVDVGVTFKAKQVFRFGFLCSNTAGTNLSLARLSGSLMQVYRLGGGGVAQPFPVRL